MKHFRFSVLVFLIWVSAALQPVLAGELTDGSVQSEQRRFELRSALKAPSKPELAEQDKKVNNATPNRHLSQQERADLRAQLRQQRKLTKPEQ